MNKTKYLILSALFLCSIAYAQSIGPTVTGNAGLTLSGGSGSLSFTVGEPVVGGIENGPSLGQGFWKGASEGLILSNEDFELGDSTAVYPNPVQDLLNIDFTDLSGSDFDLTLFDNQGRLLWSRPMDNVMRTESVDFSTLTSGMYLLQLTQRSTTTSKTFKILKK